jgi:hypothetical protein
VLLTVDGTARSVAFSEVTKAQVQVELNPPRTGAGAQGQADEDDLDEGDLDEGDLNEGDLDDDEKES